MAGQIAAILVAYWGLDGIAGFGLAASLATPIAILLGVADGAPCSIARQAAARW